MNQSIEQVNLEIPIEQTPQAPMINGLKSYKNIEIERMLTALEKHLKRIDIIGYAAARNTRILQNESKEYFDRRQILIEKYGTPQLDEDGNPTRLVELRFDSPEFKEYEKEIKEFAMIEHRPNIFKLKYEEAIGKISGEELLEIEWMFEE